MISTFSRGVSPIAVTAALSVALLIAVSGMQLGKMFAAPALVVRENLEPAAPRDYVAIEDMDANGIPDWQDELARAGLIATTSDTTASSTTISATSSDPVSGLGAALIQSLTSGYLSLKEHDAYTPERGEQLAHTLADNFRAPETFTPHMTNELALDPDTSADRILRYRADMRTALEPLLSEDEYELTFFAAYIESNNTIWLERLIMAAGRYRVAEQNVLKVYAPENAESEHLRIVNALGSYAETLDRMARFAQDPFASIALLQTYNERERDLNLAFDALVKFYAANINN